MGPSDDLLLLCLEKDPGVCMLPAQPAQWWQGGKGDKGLLTVHAGGGEEPAQWDLPAARTHHMCPLITPKLDSPVVHHKLFRNWLY